MGDNKPSFSRELEKGVGTECRGDEGRGGKRGARLFGAIRPEPRLARAFFGSAIEPNRHISGVKTPPPSPQRRRTEGVGGRMRFVEVTLVKTH